MNDHGSDDGDVTDVRGDEEKRNVRSHLCRLGQAWVVKLAAIQIVAAIAHLDHLKGSPSGMRNASENLTHG